MAHARLARRWTGKPLPILYGAWYPVLRDEPLGIYVSVDGKEVGLMPEWFELAAAPRRNAVWGVNPETETAAAVCPRGHHQGVAPAAGRYRCERCDVLYEIEG